MESFSKSDSVDLSTGFLFEVLKCCFRESHIALGLRSGNILVLNECLEKRAEFRGSGRALIRRKVSAMSITDDNQFLIVAFRDGNLKIWSLETNRLVHTIRAHRDWISDVLALPGGGRAATISWDKTCRVWNILDGRLMREFETTNRITSKLSLLGHRDVLVAGTTNGEVCVFELQGSGAPIIHKIHENNIKALADLGRGNLVASVSKDNTVCVSNAITGKKISCFWGEGEFEQCCALIGTYVILASQAGGTLHVLHAENIQHFK